jgi:hypothetical protein
VTATTPGDAIRLVMTKWGDRPHWEFDCTFLGSDEHGDWLGIPAGVTMSRPGAVFVAPAAMVTLVPRPGADAERGWLATFNGPARVYVDITTPPVWEGSVVRAIDLDLDVVRDDSGVVWVDDEDEFAEHQVRYGYPDPLVAAAAASCERVHAAVAAGTAPYDGSAARWLERVPVER